MRLGVPEWVFALTVFHATLGLAGIGMVVVGVADPSPWLVALDFATVTAYGVALWGLWRRRPWAWFLTLALAGANVVAQLIQLFFGVGTQLAVLVLLLTRSGRQAFRVEADETSHARRRSGGGIPLAAGAAAVALLIAIVAGPSREAQDRHDHLQLEGLVLPDVDGLTPHPPAPIDTSRAVRTDEYVPVWIGPNDVGGPEQIEDARSAIGFFSAAGPDDARPSGARLETPVVRIHVMEFGEPLADDLPRHMPATAAVEPVEIPGVARAVAERGVYEDVWHASSRFILDDRLYVVVWVRVDTSQEATSLLVDVTHAQYVYAAAELNRRRGGLRDAIRR